MKKNVLFILLLILMLSVTMLFTGCGGSDTPENAAEEAVEATDEAAEETQEAESTAPSETTGIAGVTTLEEYFNTDGAPKDSLGYDEDTGLELTVSGNELTYLYDLSRSGQYTVEQFKNDAYVDAYVDSVNQSLDEQGGSVFGGTAKTLEEAIGISGVKVTVTYSWEDEILVTRTYTSADATE